MSDAGTETFSDEENGFERKLSREEQVDQLIKEAGEEVVDPEVDSVPRKRRKRHQNKKGKFEKGDQKVRMNRCPIRQGRRNQWHQKWRMQQN